MRTWCVPQHARAAHRLGAAHTPPALPPLTGSNPKTQVHDAQLDYYGKRLATCSSDRVIKIFNIVGEGQQVHVADLTGHDGPVWTVCWAHPKFGGLLASCSFDRKVIIWKETQENVWTQVRGSADLVDRPRPSPLLPGAPRLTGLPPHRAAVRLVHARLVRQLRRVGPA